LRFVNFDLGNALSGSATAELMGWYDQHSIRVVPPLLQQQQQTVPSSFSNEQTTPRISKSSEAMARRRRRRDRRLGEKNSTMITAQPTITTIDATTVTVKVRMPGRAARVLSIRCPRFGRMRRVYTAVAVDLGCSTKCFRLFQNGIDVPQEKRTRDFNPEAGVLTVEDCKAEDDNEAMQKQFATANLS